MPAESLDISDILQVHVEPGDWSGAVLADIQRLLADAGSHINRELRVPVFSIVSVRLAPITDFVPRHLIQCYRPGFSKVQITATGTYWCQYVYQFMHEYCHVMIEPRFPRGGCNQWFEEAICEMSALFTLRRMSERWPTSPPYAHWSPYADSLAEYAHEKLEYIERTLPSSSEISEWFSGQEEALREHPYLRESNAVIARQLLPIFEAHPVAWNTVPQLPAGQHPSKDSPTYDYLRSWRSAVDPQDRHVVDQVMRCLAML